jgi:2-polyprenyl-6-hydroxyphenyl methylase/3-demethylubiquinone-9 3-methyltransferase
MAPKSEQVKALFEVPEKYLGPRQYDINIRVDVVGKFTDALKFERALDIGCGNGAISLPLLSRCKKLTLLDLSAGMLDLARTRIPVERRSDVELINADFLATEFEPHSFDLICCIGVLAHVDSPAEVIAKVSQLAKPGALIILEFTDSFHFWGVPVVLYQKALKLLRPEPYKLNRLKKQQILQMFQANGLETAALYRYGLPPIGSSKLLNQEQMYQATRYLFGPSDHNRNSWMGNQFIYCLQKRAVSQAC